MTRRETLLAELRQQLCREYLGEMPREGRQGRVAWLRGLIDVLVALAD